MEILIDFKRSDFTEDGVHFYSRKFFTELLSEWEEKFHNRFKPYYANTLEGHPTAMRRLTSYVYPDSNYDFGMELIGGSIDIDENLEIEKYSKYQTVYAIGSQYLDDEPIFLVKNDSLKEDILILRYDTDDENDDESIEIPLNSISVKL